MATVNFDTIQAKDLVQKKTASYSIVAEDTGKDLFFDANDKVFTLPLAAAAAGLRYRCIASNNAVGGATGSRVAPAAGDTIRGNGATPVANKTFTNTQATAKQGDLIELVSDGTDWYVVDVIGTWAYA